MKIIKKISLKNIIIILLFSILLVYGKAKLQYKGSTEYFLANTYSYAGFENGKNLTISQRLKREATKCGKDYAFSDWTFEKEAQVYRNNNIWGCTAEYYKAKEICPMNLKTYNDAYTQNYDLPLEWFNDLLSKSTNQRMGAKVFGCNLEKDSSTCSFIENNTFLRFQLFCSIMGAYYPDECDDLIAKKARTPQFVSDEEGNLTKVQKTEEQIVEDYIRNVVKTRSPIKNIKFVVVKEKDPKFLRAFIFTDLSNSNTKCEGDIGANILINIVKDLQ